MNIVEWMLGDPEIGWIAVVLYLMWEIRGPKGKVKEITDSIHSVSIVVRALARENDDIDTELVDEELDDNGTSPEDFINRGEE